MSAAEEWDEVERYAAALEKYTQSEPVPWPDFFISRGRALAAFGRGGRDAETLGELRRLKDEAERVGLIAPLPEIETALSLAGEA